MKNVTLLQDSKFKNIFVQVRFLFPLKKQRVLTYQVLSSILHESCQKYPNKYEVTKVLDDLYGAGYSCGSNVIGKMQSIACKTMIIDPEYVSKPSLLEDIFKVLHEFIFHPKLDENGFDKNVFEEAKRNVKDVLLRSEEDPTTLCLFEAMRNSGSEYALAQSVMHDAKDIDAICMEDVVLAYYDMLKNAQKNIIVVGNVNVHEVEQYIQTYLPFAPISVECPSYRMDNNLNHKRFEKTKDFSQSYITYLYTTKINNTDANYVALKLANAILGQLPTSLLFQEVREKRSLCYSIYSSLLPYDSILAITTGVEMDCIEETMQLIEQQVEAMKKGEFKDSQIEMAKKMMISSLRSTFDSAEAMIGFAYQNELLNTSSDIETYIEKVTNITKNEIIEAIKDCEFLISYVLKGQDTYEENIQSTL